MADHPSKIGKYEILGIAGRGAMGEVYLGHDPFIDRRVAIKVCSRAEDEGSSQLARKMFFNEAQAAGALDHPNILRVYDAGEANGQPYIVMEYVAEARTLRRYCKPDALLPVEDVVKIIHQCAKALDYAHRRGVLHRDIKPANLMLTQDGDVKIGDFGIAQRIHADQTHNRRVIGSPRYMSPQQAADLPLTYQTDIYSLGVSMYELLTGKPPFSAKNLSQLAMMIRSEEATPIRELRPEVPEPLEAIVKRAMEKSLEWRYKSGGEMAADLAALYDRINRDDAVLTPEQRFAAARALRFFNEFSDSELEEVLEVGVWEQHAPGREIITEGAMEQALYILVSGEVNVVVGDRIVGTLGKGDCVGELGFLTQAKRSATVVARDDVTTLKIDSALMEWASIPVQMRFNKVFQQTLIERLTRTTVELAKRMDGELVVEA